MQYVNGKARWSILHSVISLAGTSEWQIFSKRSFFLSIIYRTELNDIVGMVVEI